ncbi:hypothetical protein [Aquisalimonas asiatica]|uniref:Lipid A 3-O-deacylase (PagL) n=1 Tax=Aquisalimonas asiatica TaxID=406100 RepID=A0A1H8S5T2_9GAMM|nr:hypothetical protein [Aquisalimonas asiatica]SEO73972.1 hypothetical protein SAMN04488052_102517 [Aquisalimonas asiatica]
MTTIGPATTGPIRAWSCGGRRIAGLALVLLIACVPAGANKTPGPWTLTGLVGQYDDSRFLEILALEGGHRRASYLGAAILARDLGQWPGPVAWEGELQAVRHWGKQSLWESNVAVTVRWNHFPWDDWVDTSAAFGQGVSFASRRPPLEKENDSESRRMLHYMHAELAFSPPGNQRLSLVARVHHRSGMFGVYGVSGGSNFLTTGLRYRF